MFQNSFGRYSCVITEAGCAFFYCSSSEVSGSGAASRQSHEALLLNQGLCLKSYAVRLPAPRGNLVFLSSLTAHADSLEEACRWLQVSPCGARVNFELQVLQENVQITDLTCDSASAASSSSFFFLFQSFQTTNLLFLSCDLVILHHYMIHTDSSLPHI